MGLLSFLAIFFLVITVKPPQIYSGATTWGRIVYTDSHGNIIGLNGVKVYARTYHWDCPEGYTHPDEDVCTKVYDKMYQTTHSSSPDGILCTFYAGPADQNVPIYANGDGYFCFGISCGQPDWHIVVEGFEDPYLAAINTYNRILGINNLIGTYTPPGIPAGGTFSPSDQSVVPQDSYMPNYGDFPVPSIRYLTPTPNPTVPTPTPTPTPVPCTKETTCPPNTYCITGVDGKGTCQKISPTPNNPNPYSQTSPTPTPGALNPSITIAPTIPFLRMKIGK